MNSVPQEVRDFMSKIAREASAKMTPEQRKERARKAGLNKGKNAKTNKNNGASEATQ